MNKLFFTCEHASNHVPDLLSRALGGKKVLLSSHRAYDPGALEVAQHLAKATGAPLVAGTCTRLAVDLNRSPSNPKRFSEWSRRLGREGMTELENRWYFPFRKKVMHQIAALCSNNRHVVHVSVHTFTPVLHGVKRDADIGLLYDPARIDECRFAQIMKTVICEIIPELHIRCNYPYRGTADGMTSGLRKMYSDERYTGIELEINQKLFRTQKWHKCFSVLEQSILQAALL